MGAAGPWEIAFWYASLLLKTGLLARLAWLRLAGEYPALSAFLALQVVRTLWLMQYSTMSSEYTYAWLFTEPLLILSKILAVFELYEKILASYRGLSILSRNTMTAVLAVSFALSVAAHYSEFTLHGDLSRRMKAVVVVDTVISTAMLLFILALAAFMLWFPMPVRKNPLVHCGGLASYYLITVASLYVRQMNLREWGRLSSSWRMLATDIITVAWILLITKRGEEESKAVSFHFAPDSQERLLGQLDALNRALESRRRQA